MLFLAFRHLSARPRQTFLIVLGILLGTMAYVIISGMMLGFQEYMTNQLVNNDAHIRISSRKEYIEPAPMTEFLFPQIAHAFWIAPPSGIRNDQHIYNPQGWFSRLDEDSRVVAYSPQLSAQVIFRRAKVSVTGRLIGMDSQKQSRVTNIANYMTSGKFFDLGESGNRLVVGEGLLKELGARVSETLQISLGQGAPTPFKIIGSFRIGAKSVDDSTAYAALADVQRINQTRSQITDIAIRTTDFTGAAEMATNWSALSLDRVESWDQTNENILSVFKTQDIVRNSMTLAILVVAAFGIYNILSILVNQKRRDIAILRSMGFEGSDILKLFFSQGVILGSAGGLFGIFIGYLVCLYLQTIPVAPGRIGADGHLIISFTIAIYLKAFVFALISSLFASWLPARLAGRLTPIDVIRGENS